jgi:hypothetical protein
MAHFIGEYDGGQNLAKVVRVDTTNFDGVLSDLDDNVQKALETLDNHSHTPDDIGAVSKAAWNQNGFPNRTSSAISFTNSTRTFSIQPTATNFSYYIAGVEYISTGNTVVITDTEGVWVIYYGGATLTALNSPTMGQMDSIIRTKALVSILYWNATDNEAIYVGEERHGMGMAPETHAYLHFVEGLRHVSGLSLMTFSVDGTGATADAQFAVEAGGVSDEDIYDSISAIASTTGLPIYHMIGAGAAWKKTIVSGFSARTSGGTSATNIAYNQYTGGAWQLTAVGNNDYCLYHIFATTEKDLPIISIMGQAVYTTLSQARSGAYTEISNLLLNNVLFPEIRALGTVIYQANSSYANDVNARIRSTDEGDDYIDWRFEAIARTSISTTDHNLLTNLQGGAAGEYYHLTAAKAGYIDQSVVSGATPTFGDIKGETKVTSVTIMNPSGAYTLDTQIPIMRAKSALTVTAIYVTLNTTSYEVAGDLKWADNLTSFTNATVINDFDTTSGVRTDTSISSGSVASGKEVYLQFDSQPNVAVTFMKIDIHWDID